MSNEMKKNELNEYEMEVVTGGGIGSNDDFLLNETDRDLFFREFTQEQREQVLAQPDRASRRAKMVEIWRANKIHATGTGASGGWY